MNSNRSIQKICFNSMVQLGGEIFQSLRPFFENNNNLSELAVRRCEFGAGCARQFSSALRACNKSLKLVRFYGNQMGGERLVDIIEAMSAHPQLEQLQLPSMNIGRNESAAIASLLSHTAAELHTLDLGHNDIDDEGVEILVGALTNCRLRNLFLHCNHNITARGWQSIAALLETPNSLGEAPSCW